MPTNNEVLKVIKADLGLSNVDIGHMLNISINTVNSWTCGVNTTSYRQLPETKLRLIKILTGLDRGKK